MSTVTGWYSGSISGSGVQWNSGEKYGNARDIPSSQGYWISQVYIDLNTYGAYTSYSGQTCYLDIKLGGTVVGTMSFTRQVKTGLIDVPYNVNYVGKEISFQITVAGIRNQVYFSCNVSSVPYRIYESSIATATSITGAGDSCVVTMNAPSWINASGGIQYTQWFCSTSPTYSDNWWVGETTGEANSSQTFTLTKEILKAKGATPGTTMYLFCRSIYKLNDTFYGQNENVWSLVSYTGTYVYHENPYVITPPYITSVSPSTGNSCTVVVSDPVWNEYTSGGTQYLQMRLGKTTTFANSRFAGDLMSPTGQGGTFTYAKWLFDDIGCVEGDMVYLFVLGLYYRDSIYYGDSYPVSYSGTFVFSNNADNTVKVYDGVSYIQCIPFVYNGATWQQCIPYVYDGSSWIECSH